MPEENVVSPQPSGPPPANYVSEEPSLRFIQRDTVQEPSIDETTDTAEDTALKNEVEAPDMPEAKAGGEAEHSSKVISDLGEDRKRLAGELIDLARESEAAAEKVKELMSADPRMEKLIKTKFGTDYDRIMSGEPLKPLEEDEPKVDIEKIKQQARIEAKAEVIMKEAEATKKKQLDVFAQYNGITVDEVELIQEHAELLESKYGFEKALDMALLIVNRDKAQASDARVEMPRGGTVTKAPESTDVEVTPELRTFAARNGRSVEGLVEGIKRVEERMTKDERGRTKFILKD